MKKIFLAFLISCFLSAPVYASTIIADWTTGTKTQAGKIYAQTASNSRHGAGFEFITTGIGFLASIQFRVVRVDNGDPGPTGYLTAQVYSVDGAHLPDTRLGESTTKLDVTTISTSDEWQTFYFTPPVLLANATHYILMLERPTTGDAFTGDTDNYIGLWGSDKTDIGTSYKIHRDKDDAYSATYRDDYPWHQTGTTRPERRVMTVQ